MTRVSLILPPDQPPTRFLSVAREAESAGLEQLWLWEDCFGEGGLVSAAAILAGTERLRVGVGLMPAPLRNVGLAAMELATLTELFPGRLVAGVGHGVQSWMGQVGARVASPLTLLREYHASLRRLLDGETVTVRGRYVALDDVTLRWPPQRHQPLLMGARGPRTVDLAAEVADGIIFDGEIPDDDVRAAVERARAVRAERPLDVVAFTATPRDITADDLEGHVAARAATGVDEVPVLVLEPEGRPDGTERMVEAIPALVEVQRRLG